MYRATHAHAATRVIVSDMDGKSKTMKTDCYASSNWSFRWPLDRADRVGERLRTLYRGLL